MKTSSLSQKKWKDKKAWTIHECIVVFHFFKTHWNTWFSSSEIAEHTKLCARITDLLVQSMHKKGWVQFRDRIHGRVYALRNSVLRMNEDVAGVMFANVCADAPNN